GRVLGADLARRAGAAPASGAVVAFASSLSDPAVVHGSETATSLFAVDVARDREDVAYVLVPEGSGYRLAQVSVDGARGGPARAEQGWGSDLTRSVRTIPAGAQLQDVPDQRRVLADDDLAAWTALGLALTSADLVGVMRGVLDVTVAYAAERKQYGVAVGSFQAVQHLLAEARCLLEGSASAALYAAWAVDHASPAEAVAAGRVAKAYCARAAQIGRAH